MPAAAPVTATRTAGLSERNLQAIREGLSSGRRPKVVFTDAAGQIAGQSGHVVKLTDPSAGEDFVVVRFGHDELPFSPTDLMIPVRGSARATRRPADASFPPEFVLAAPPAPAPRSDGRAAVAAPRSQGRPTVAAAPAPHRDNCRVNGRVAKPKPPAALTVTLSYTDGQWSVGAQQGSRALAKPYAIKAAEALKMVALLDVPGVQDAVETIVAAERAAARQRAQRLRDELAEIEARLAELG